MAKVVCATRVGNMKDPNPETRGTVDVLDLPVKELGDDDVLIKVAYCGICGSDPHVVDGCFNKPEDAPFGIGHEMSGRSTAPMSAISPAWRSMSSGTRARYASCPRA